MTVHINEPEWQKIRAAHEKTAEDLRKAEKELRAAAAYMPECWADDASVADFVASLVAGGTDYPGHTDDCDCFE